MEYYCDNGWNTIAAVDGILLRSEKPPIAAGTESRSTPKAASLFTFFP